MTTAAGWAGFEPGDLLERVFHAHTPGHYAEERTQMRSGGRAGHYEGDAAWSENTREVARATMRVLGDGMWHERRELLQVRQQYEITRETHAAVMDYLGVAESDSGRYYCIPRPWTQTYSPDGT
jgi:hypothetical protein